MYLKAYIESTCFTPQPSDPQPCGIPQTALATPQGHRPLGLRKQPGPQLRAGLAGFEPATLRSPAPRSATQAAAPTPSGGMFIAVFNYIWSGFGLKESKRTSRESVPVSGVGPFSQPFVHLRSQLGADNHVRSITKGFDNV